MSDAPTRAPAAALFTLGLAVAFTLVAPLAAQDHQERIAAAIHSVTSHQAQNEAILSKPAVLEVENVSLEKALRVLQTQSGVLLAYSPMLLPKERRVTCRCRDATVDEALRTILVGTRLETIVVGEQVVVRRTQQVVPPPRAASPVLARPAGGPMAWAAESPAARDNRPVSLTLRQGNLTGLVTNTQGLAPIASAQVHIPELGIGALSDAGGRYHLIDVPVGTHTVVVERLGFRAVSQTVTVTDGQTVRLDFRLTQEALALDEIIVTGTPGGTQRRAIGNVVDRLDAGTRVQTVPVTNMKDLLGQQAASLHGLTGLDGNIGTSGAVRIRGVSSFSLASRPLIVVDGVRVADAVNAGPALREGRQVSRLDDLNPRDIESIEIIKGPAAATLYGTEASAGVIQIITRRGSSGAPSFNVTVQQGTSWLMNPAGRFADTYWYHPDTGHRDTMNVYRVYEEREGHPIFSYGRYQNYNANVAGGTDVIRYFASADWSDEVGIVDYNWQKHFSTRGNISFMLGDAWDIDVNLGFTRRNARFANAATSLDLWSFIVWSHPDQCDGPTECFRYAPPRVGAMVDSRAGVNRFIGSFQVRHQPLSWLQQRLIVGSDYASERDHQLYPRVPEGEFNFFGAQGVGQKTVRSIFRTNHTVDYGATASFRLTPTVSSATSFGVQYYERSTELNESFGRDFPSTAITTVGGAAITTAGETFSENKSLGTYIQQQLGWNDRLFVTGALRGDDNSAFGADFDAALYPKFSATWVISEEPFWDYAWVDQLRLRTAWGQAGMQPGTFDAVTLYTPVTGPGDSPVLTPRTLGNPELKPEVGSEIELGFDASLFANRLNMEITYFDKTTKDAILASPIRPSAGFPGFRMINMGEVKNAGIELAIGTTPLERRTYGLDLNLVFATQNNEITALGTYETPTGEGTRHMLGYPIGTWFARTPLHGEFIEGSVIPTNMMCDGGTGTHGKDIGGPPVPCEEAPRLAQGQPEPTWLGNVNASLRIGDNLRFYGQVDFKGGHTGLDMSAGSVRSMNSTIVNNPMNDPVVAWILCCGDRDLPGHYDAGFARLREVSVSYNLPDRWVAGFGASRASVNLGARNLGFLWRAMKVQPIAQTKIFDPEQAQNQDRTGLGYSRGFPPLSRLVATMRISF